MQLLTPLDLVQIRNRVSELLNHMGSQLISTPDDAELQARVARLGQIAAGLAVVDPDCLPPEGAGYASLVEVQNVATGDVDEHVLMVGSLVDIHANQVSLASPIGQALLGRVPGDEIEVATPSRHARLRITRVVTLSDALQAYET